MSKQNEKYKFSIVVPCYNEEKNIPILVERFKNFIENENILIVLVNKVVLLIFKSGLGVSLVRFSIRVPNPAANIINLKLDIIYKTLLYTSVND